MPPDMTPLPATRVLLHVSPRLFAEALRTMIVGHGFEVLTDDEPTTGGGAVILVHDRASRPTAAAAAVGIDGDGIHCVSVGSRHVDVGPSTDDRAADLLLALDILARRREFR